MLAEERQRDPARIGRNVLAARAQIRILESLEFARKFGAAVERGAHGVEARVHMGFDPPDQFLVATDFRERGDDVGLLGAGKGGRRATLEVALDGRSRDAEPFEFGGNLRLGKH